MKKVIDAHIHFEHQDYSLEIIDKMVETAIKNGVNEIHLLDHTHKFKEFAFLYTKDSLEPIFYTHFENRKYISIQDYLNFIKIVRLKSYPVTIKFGLEVCYFKEHEDELKRELSKYHFDFIIGSVHFVDGFAYDWGKEYWENRDIELIYKRYYETVFDLINSRIFDHLGHPDAIKIYGYYPSFDLTSYYEKVAELLSKTNMTTENNSGFFRHGFTNYGLDEKLYEILKIHNVTIYRSSDAHKYDFIGAKFDELRI